MKAYQFENYYFEDRDFAVMACNSVNVIEVDVPEHFEIIKCDYEWSRNTNTNHDLIITCEQMDLTDIADLQINIEFHGRHEFQFNDECKFSQSDLSHEFQVTLAEYFDDYVRPDLEYYDDEDSGFEWERESNFY